jgi:hypothetical protein
MKDKICFTCKVEMNPEWESSWEETTWDSQKY